MMPKTSNDESGAEVSGTWSRESEESDASPYLTLTGWNGFCPLDESGWMISPSMAAQMTSFLAIPVILWSGHQDLIPARIIEYDDGNQLNKSTIYSRMSRASKSVEAQIMCCKGKSAKAH